MVQSPFRDAGQHFSKIGTGLADVGGRFGVEVSRVGQDMSGKTATALMERLDDYRRECETLSEHATSMVTACAVQVDNDNALLAAPGPADVDAAQEKVQRAIQADSLPSLIASRVQLQEIKGERDAAYKVHEDGTGVTRPKLVEPEEPPSMKRRGTGTSRDGEYGDGVQLMPLNRPITSPFPAGGGGSGGMPVMPPMSADQLSTKLSGDTESAAAAAARGMATPTQPQMPPMQQGGAPAGGGSPMSGMPTAAMPGAAMPKPKPKDKNTSDGADFTMLSADTGAAAAGGALTAGSPDRGGSLHGVTTKADVSGARPQSVGMRTPGPVPPMGGGPMGGPMGGGMMGGGGGLHGANSSSKRAEVFAHDKKLQGDDAVDAAVQDGLIGRKSAKPPTHGKED